MSKQKTAVNHSKTDIRYWRDVVFRPTARAGKQDRRAIPQFYVKIQFQGRRETIPLRTNNQEKAADEAKQFYLSLVANGWEQALLEINPHKKAPKAATATVGDLITAALQRNDVGRRTVADYARAFRQLVAQSLGLGWGNGSRTVADQKQWARRVDATPLAKVTSQAIEAWRQKCLGEAATGGPVALRHAKNSLNSLLRKCKALLSPKFLRHLDMGAGFISPLAGVGQEPRQSMRYQSQIDLDTLMAAALHGDDARELQRLPEPQLKIFLLAGLVGLRRNEVDKLEWSSFIWNENIIRPQATEYFQPKTEESLADVDVDADLMHLFKQFHEKAVSVFVVESPVAPRLNASYAHYRCDAVFKRLTIWLKKAGVPGVTPLHTLRKEFGSLMCSRYGIYAASRALRHRDIYITSQHYLDTKTRFVPGLSAALKGLTAKQSR